MALSFHLRSKEKLQKNSEFFETFSIPDQVCHSPSKNKKRVQIRTLESSLIQATFFSCILMLEKVDLDMVYQGKEAKEMMK